MTAHGVGCRDGAALRCQSPSTEQDMTTRTVARQCTLCEAHCGIKVTVEEDQVTKIEGDPNDVLSAGYICPKATALADLHHDPERLRRPVMKVGDTWEEISFDDAFALIGQRLRAVQREHGRSAVGMYYGNPAAHSPSVIYAAALRAALLTRHAYSASSIDQFPQEHAAWRMFGSNVVLAVPDIDRTDHLLIIGANPAVSNGSLATMPNAKGRIRAVRERGGTVVVVDPRRTETARLADSHVAVAPGGDPYLLLAMLHVLFDDGLEPPAHLAGMLVGFDQLRQLVAAWTPEDAAPMAGVDADVIRQMARELGAAERAVIYARVGVCHQVTGTLTHWLVNVLNAVTGNLDRAGGQMFATPPVDAMRLLRRLPLAKGPWTDRAGEHDVFRFELPVATLADAILGPPDGVSEPDAIDPDHRVRAMITHAGNPVLSAPGGRRLDEAFDALDFHVAIDMYVTETSRHADIILPPVSHLEREEFDFLFPAFSVRNNARWNARVFEPPADGLEDWEILARLMIEVTPLVGRRLTGQIARRVVDQLSPLRISAAGMAIGPHGRLRRGRGALTVDSVRRTPGGIDLGPLQPRLAQLLATRDRRVHLAPDDLLSAADELIRDAQTGVRPDDAPIGYDLRLIGRRHLRTNNSWLANVPAMVKGRDRCTVLMHPDDAHARALTNRARALVRSPYGQIELPVEVSAEIRPGTVAIPHGWGHDQKGVGWSTAAAHGGANVNELHDPARTDRFSGNAAVNGTWVTVTVIQGALTALPI
ncbi:MAG: anaerobic selenocysteine-containing dehydrogenase [Nitriliruptoraceae bacterium]|jgi:anaerobic selenocysteine-containing dehydrogenase